MNIRSFVGALVLGIISAGGAAAQPSVQAVFGASLDTVDRQSFATDSSSAPAGTFSVDYLANDERLRVFYTFDGGTFSSEGDWHYVQHGAGARYRFDIAPGTRLFTGGTASFRDNGDSWSAASYRGAGLFSNLERDLGRGTLRLGARADRRTFADQAELDQWELGGFASGRVSFPTRTTLISELSFGWKRFDQGATWVETTGSSPAALSTYRPAGNAPAGNGNAGSPQGQGNAPNAGPGNAVTAGGMGPAAHATTLVAAAGERATQVTLFGRVAQSLADRLAASLEVTWRDASGTAASSLVTTPEMLIDDGVYDDPYASDALVLRLGLKRVFDGGRFLEGGASRWTKNYDATPALDASGAPMPGLWREDDVWRVEASWYEPIAPGRTGNLDLALLTTYTFMDSVSTDAYYTYRSHRLRAMISIGY